MLNKKIYLLFLFVVTNVVGQSPLDTNKLAHFSTLVLNGVANVKLNYQSQIKHRSYYYYIRQRASGNTELSVVQQGEKLSVNGNNSTDTLILLAPVLSEIILSNRASITTDTSIEAHDLIITAENESKTNLCFNKNTNKITVKAEGNSRITLSGSASRLYINANDSSRVQTFFLKAPEVFVKANEASNTLIYSDDYIYAEAAGSSIVNYTFGKDGKTIEVNKKDSAVIEKSYQELEKSSNKLAVGARKFPLKLGIDLFFNRYNITDPNSNAMKLKSSSHGLAFNLYLPPLKLIGRHLTFRSAIGYSMNYFKFSNNIALNADSSYTSIKVDPLVNYKKNLLALSYIQAPLYFEYIPTNYVRKSFFFSAGVQVGY
ncbi:MAG TPA: DUF2807 domain-containing protein, partial [Bacteroidia bacterium]|nr:DUF2807 domain-containing protein [Bacteroidia bacterium]